MSHEDSPTSTQQVNFETDQDDLNLPPGEKIEARQMSILDRLQDPESGISKEPQLLGDELASLMSDSRELLEIGEIDLEKLEEVTKYTSTVIKQIITEWDTKRVGRDCKSVKQFWGVAEQLTTAYEIIDASKEPSLAVDVERTELLLRVSQDQKSIHKKFTDKHLASGELLKDDSEIDPSVLSIWRSPEFLHGMSERTTGNFEKHQGTKNWPKEEIELLDRTLKAFGFSPEEFKVLKKSWASRKDQNGLVDRAKIRTIMVKNIEKMAIYATVRPDFAHDLHRKFGINNFDRYRVSTLYRQHKRFEDIESGKSEKGPVRLVVTATDDWNGAFRSPENIYSELKPIYMEASSLRGVASAMIRTRKIGLMSALIVTGHGHKDGIEMRSGSGNITKEMMQQSTSLKTLKDRRNPFFTADAEIVLASCSTGKKGGIAESISKISGITVIAPEENTYVRVERDEEEPELHTINYLDTDKRSKILGKISRRLVPRHGVTFIQGKRRKHKKTNLYD